MGRYGQKTRPGEAVSGFGVKSSSGGGASRTLGGGGSDMGNPSQGHGGGGGGGGVAHSIIPVSGPAPVVIGAGGAGGVYVGPATGPGSPTNTWYPGAIGGTSSFGSPTSPVFFYVEGGGGGNGGGKDPSSNWSDINSGYAPAMGGSAGSLGSAYESPDSGPGAGGSPNNMTQMTTKTGGRFGNPTYAGPNWAGGGGGQGQNRYQGGSAGIYIPTLSNTVGWVGAGAMRGEYNSSSTHGAGTTGYYFSTGGPTNYYGCASGSNAVANKGGGGFGGRVRQAFPAPLSPEAPGMSPPLPSGGANGGIGGSGVAIVRYWQ